MNLKVHDPQTRQTIVRLLSSMASAKEISQYLKRYSQLEAARFAVVKVGGAVLRDDLDALVSSLAFLQDVGLTPIVIHGAGPQLDEAMTAAGIDKRSVDGLRVTTPEVLAVVRRVLQAQNLVLVEALQDQGWRIPDAAVYEGLAQARWPARLEVLGRSPLFLLDGGHNPQCAQALAESVRELLPGAMPVVLVGVLADKDWPAILAAVTALIVLACIDFDSLFVLFHKVAFTNDLWLLNPQTDLLIRLMPIEFFISYAAIIGCCWLLGMTGLLVFATIRIKKLQDKGE